MAHGEGSASIPLENVGPKEAEQIASVVASTEKQLQNRYAKTPPFLRGVHPKAHGCVKARFTVLNDLPPDYRVGVLAHPKQEFDADIRFSNAAPLVTADSPLDEPPPESGPARGHGSRGMAIKLHGVGGTRLVPEDGQDTQDFLMINQRVFAFANVEDYAVLSEIIAQNEKAAPLFFKKRIKTDAAGKPDMSDLATMRAVRTLQIISQIKRMSFPPGFQFPPEFQAPPLSPFDNSYFTAAPFLFGEGRVAKFSAKPVAPASDDLGKEVAEKDYLRAALIKRLAAGQEIVFEFQVQVRSAAGFKDAATVENDIENACTLWPEKFFPFVTVATITIPPQDIDTQERTDACERLEFSPWHGLAEHRPLGGINRMRRTVYEKSVELRRCPAGVGKG